MNTKHLNNNINCDLVKWKFFIKYFETGVVKGKGLFDVRTILARMRVLTGGSHLAFQSTAASGRQCTTARRLRNSLSYGYRSCLVPWHTWSSYVVFTGYLRFLTFYLQYEYYLDSYTRFVIATFISEKTPTRANIQQHVDASAGHPSRRAQEENEAD